MNFNEFNANSRGANVIKICANILSISIFFSYKIVTNQKIYGIKGKNES
jgi:hypothetical protein